MCPLTAGLLLAFAAAALNEVQEHRLDALMERTRRRPIPSGKISPAGATVRVVVLAMIALGGLLWLGALVAQCHASMCLCPDVPPPRRH